MMKRILFFIFFLAAATGINAQDKILIKEQFENNRLGWDESFEKDFSCSLNDGFLELQSKKDELSVTNVTELPISLNGNFKITSHILVPRLNDKYFFGIIFNYNDENNYNSFVVSEKRFRLYNRTNGIDNLSRHNSIILNAGKDKLVMIEMEKRGDKLTFNVDNMEVLKITKKLDYSTFGFIVRGASTIKVMSVDIEYDPRED